MPDKKSHRIIIEGVELAGKSFITHQIYDFIESKYNTHQYILDGCHWINADVNIFGTPIGKEMIDLYIRMGELLYSKNKNVIFEKLHISDQAYNEFYNGVKLDYREEEERLLRIGAKIILCVVDPNPKIFKTRLENRLTQSFHYHRMKKTPEQYVELQEKYKEMCSKTRLPVLEVNLSTLPNPDAEKQILNWLGESD